MLEATDRQCKLCSVILELDKSKTDTEDILISPYFEQEFLQQALESEDFILFNEGLRLLQNLLRNSKARAEFMSYCANLTAKLYETSVKLLKQLSKEQKFEFIDDERKQLKIEDCKRLMTSILGISINLTCTDRKENVDFLTKFKFIDTFIDLIGATNTDLVRQEQAIWALRNFSQTEDACKQIIENKKITQCVVTLLKTNVSLVCENVCGMLCNIFRYYKGKIAEICSETDLVNEIIRQFSAASFQLQGIACELLCIVLQSESVQKDLIFDELVELLVQKIQSNIDDHNPEVEQFSTPGAMLLLTELLSQNYNEERMQKMTKLICNSVSAMNGIILRVKEQEYYCCIAAARLFRQLVNKMPAECCRILNGSKEVKANFVIAMKRGKDAYFPIESVRNDCRATLEQIEEIPEGKGLVEKLTNEK